MSAAWILTLSCWLPLPPGPSCFDLPADVYAIKTRKFMVPFCVEPDRRAEVKELRLYASTNEGKTWNQVATAAAMQSHFVFQAPTDGCYWFSVRMLIKDDSLEPKQIADLQPLLKVRVDTRRKPMSREVAVQELKQELQYLQGNLRRLEQRLAELEKDESK